MADWAVRGEQTSAKWLQVMASRRVDGRRLGWILLELIVVVLVGGVACVATGKDWKGFDLDGFPRLEWRLQIVFALLQLSGRLRLELQPLLGRLQLATTSDQRAPSRRPARAPLRPFFRPGNGPVPPGACKSNRKSAPACRCEWMEGERAGAGVERLHTLAGA